MARKRYLVALSDDERTHLLALTRKGTSAARTLRRAQILLLVDEGATDATIAASVHVGAATVARTRRKFAEGGLQRALTERPRPGRERRLDGRQEAHLVALACSQPPDGRKDWTMQLLADRLMTLGVVATISDETVRRVLKKGGSNRG
jgi:transposase